MVKDAKELAREIHEECFVDVSQSEKMRLEWDKDIAASIILRDRLDVVDACGDAIRKEIKPMIPFWPSAVRLINQGLDSVKENLMSDENAKCCTRCGERYGYHAKGTNKCPAGNGVFTTGPVYTAVELKIAQLEAIEMCREAIRDVYIKKCGMDRTDYSVIEALDLVKEKLK